MDCSRPSAFRRFVLQTKSAAITLARTTRVVDNPERCLLLAVTLSVRRLRRVCGEASPAKGKCNSFFFIKSSDGCEFSPTEIDDSTRRTSLEGTSVRPPKITRAPRRFFAVGPCPFGGRGLLPRDLESEHHIDDGTVVPHTLCRQHLRALLSWRRSPACARQFHGD